MLGTSSSLDTSLCLYPAYAPPQRRTHLRPMRPSRNLRIPYGIPDSIPSWNCTHGNVLTSSTITALRRVQPGAVAPPMHLSIPRTPRHAPNPAQPIPIPIPIPITATPRPQQPTAPTPGALRSRRPNSGVCPSGAEPIPPTRRAGLPPRRHPAPLPGPHHCCYGGGGGGAPRAGAPGYHPSLQAAPGAGGDGTRGRVPRPAVGGYA